MISSLSFIKETWRANKNFCSSIICVSDVSPKKKSQKSCKRLHTSLEEISRSMSTWSK